MSLRFVPPRPAPHSPLLPPAFHLEASKGGGTGFIVGPRQGHDTACGPATGPTRSPGARGILAQKSHQNSKYFFEKGHYVCSDIFAHPPAGWDLDLTAL